MKKSKAYMVLSISLPLCAHAEIPSDVDSRWRQSATITHPEYSFYPNQNVDFQATRKNIFDWRTQHFQIGMANLQDSEELAVSPFYICEVESLYNIPGGKLLTSDIMGPGNTPPISTTCKSAQALGLTWLLPTELDDGQLAALFYPQADTTILARHVVPDWPSVHQELKRKGVSKQLLWEEYTQRYPNSCYSYSQFCDRYKSWSQLQKRSMRQIHKAGEKLFIDYCGPTVPIVSPTTGEVRQAQIFVAVLGASNYTFAEATWSQSLPDWL